jgi:hypothetical protein
LAWANPEARKTKLKTAKNNTLNNVKFMIIGAQ